MEHCYSKLTIILVITFFRHVYVDYSFVFALMNVLCRLNCILYFYFKVYSFVADVLTDRYRLRASLVQAAHDYLLTHLFVFNTISIVDLYK